MEKRNCMGFECLRRLRQTIVFSQQTTIKVINSEKYQKNIQLYIQCIHFILKENKSNNTLRSNTVRCAPQTLHS